MEATERGDNDKSERGAKLEVVIEKARNVCDRLQDKTIAAAKGADEIVREYPYQAVGIAFGVGLLIGVLVTGSRSD
jgi:ElaB/YqjD/DUF883 family membrane-anchored ribosome-binding protein